MSIAVTEKGRKCDHSIKNNIPAADGSGGGWKFCGQCDRSRGLGNEFTMDRSGAVVYCADDSEYWVR